ncbi:sulfotransferase domain-containing protein [Nitrospirillum iridis]|uniref:Aryl sulfotransferase n=1 Tax=Nitrospirillum iridis TaxID=765888 RepID=A0A7X0EF71_9PROT|nr:sulfotransferase domain-containing protein [Nitrospirillum iridis]MBB6253710.1 aryl sulfotransferase [Nitrospirillum iridis]
MGGFYWIASYPKSGNTWMRLMLASLIDGAPPDFSKAIGFAGAVGSVTDMDLYLDVESSDLTPVEQAELRHDLALVTAAAAAKPQFRKVHDRWGHTPTGRPLFPPKVTLGSVYLVRDPRDVAVSWAHHSGLSLDASIAFLGQSGAVVAKSGRWKDQFEQRLDSWSCHVASWLEADPTPLLVAYERLSADPAGVLANVAAHCGIAASDAAVAGAVAATQFDRLRREEETHGFDLGQRRGRAFFRRGRAGGWRDTLSAAQADRIVQDHGPMMARLGYI